MLHINLLDFANMEQVLVKQHLNKLSNKTLVEKTSKPTEEVEYNVDEEAQNKKADYIGTFS